MNIRVALCAIWIGMGLLSASFAPIAHAQQLISNGDFELGSLAGWTVAEQPGGYGSYFIATDVFAPISGLSTVGPAGGNNYAVSDSLGYGAQALLQTFTLPAGSSSVTISFDMFVNDWSGVGPIIDPSGLDYSFGPNQYARVDILTAGASALDTGSGVVMNLYEGVDAPGVAPPTAYTHYVFDLTSLQGGSTYQIRFGSVNTEFFLNQGIDNVSVSSVTAVPEPGTLSLLLSAAATGNILLRYRRRSQQKSSLT